MQPSSEDRGAIRFDHFSPLHVNDLKSGGFYEARMSDYSNSGIYFESDGLFQKDTKIYISMQDSPYDQSSDVLKYVYGEVMWRKELKSSSSKYGYGIQLFSGIRQQEFEQSDPKEKDLRKHPRKPFFRNIRFSSYKGSHEGDTKNVSASGLYVASREKFKAGQWLKLNLPLKNGKTAEIMGQIVWLTDEGFGLKFQKEK